MRLIGLVSCTLAPYVGIFHYNAGVETAVTMLSIPAFP
jgi:hypothetical protein